jgi:hypothetical protein
MGALPKNADFWGKNEEFLGQIRTFWAGFGLFRALESGRTFSTVVVTITYAVITITNAVILTRSGRICSCFSGVRSIQRSAVIRGPP